jgi:hypothetical protein
MYMYMYIRISIYKAKQKTKTNKQEFQVTYLIHLKSINLHPKTEHFSQH